MHNDLATVLDRHDYQLYTTSIREIDGGAAVFTVRRDGLKFVGVVGSQQSLGLIDPVDTGIGKLESGAEVGVYPLTWENYQRLAEVLPLSPSPCDRSASFGTGDRLGMVTSAHLAVHGRYRVFPVIAQQSPRELERTGRSFRSILLDAVMGVLESGWTGAWGADADHVKDEGRFLEGMEAGFSMFTLDVSDDLQDLDGLDPAEMTDREGALTEVSRKIVQDWAGSTLTVPGAPDHTFAADELTRSAIIYEKSMQRVERFHGVAKSKLSAFDLEVSIDEGSRDTIPEDHLFVAEYLHRVGVDFWSLAPKFPGEFQKAVDYMGDSQILERSFRTHGELARKLQGYRLSLHSGSDKFSIYKLFAEATGGHFHIKTSGTSWLQALKLVAHEKSRPVSRSLRPVPVGPTGKQEGIPRLHNPGALSRAAAGTVG